MISIKSDRAFLALPWFLVVLLSSILFFLGIQHSKLRNDFLEHRRADGRLARGTVLPVLFGNAVDGSSQTVSADSLGRRQVLFLLTATCPYCQQTLPYWKELAKKIQSSPDLRATVIAVTTDSPSIAQKYARQNSLPFPLVPFPDRRTAAVYKGFIIPQTVIVDSAGRILFARVGALVTKEAADSLLSALKVKPLPKQLVKRDTSATVLTSVNSPRGKP